MDMKKVFVLALMAVSMTVMAQTVTPLSINLADLKIDSLRALYISEPTMYRASLDVVEQQLNKNAADIKAAKAQLKVEQDHGKQLANSLKEASKMTASLKKLYAQEEKELKSMQKVIENQQKTVNKQAELNQETRDGYLRFLEKEQKELGYSLREVAERQRSIMDLETAIQNGQTGLQKYLNETNQKAADIAQIEAQYKELVKNLAAEQKAAKAMK